MSAIVKMLVGAVKSGKIKLEDIGNNFGLHDKVKEALKAEEQEKA